jgi:hypothetical protein
MIIELLSPLGKVLKLKNNQKLAVTAIAQKNINNAIKNYEQRLKDIQLSKTPEGIEQTFANKICDFSNMSIKYKSHIKDERQRGKISGYINVVKVKKWGDYAYEYDKKTASNANTYKMKYKEKFDFKRCISSN